MKKITIAMIAAIIAASIPTAAQAAGCRLWKRHTNGSLYCACYYGVPCTF